MLHVANQEHSDCVIYTMVLVQDGTGTVICNVNCAYANQWIVPLNSWVISTSAEL